MEDGFDEDIEFGDEISDDDEDDVDNVSFYRINWLPIFFTFHIMFPFVLILKAKLYKLGNLFRYYLYSKV